jgi:hypothetical protein
MISVSILHPCGKVFMLNTSVPRLKEKKTCNKKKPSCLRQNAIVWLHPLGQVQGDRGCKHGAHALKNAPRVHLCLYLLIEKCFLEMLGKEKGFVMHRYVK